jgi:hypothetical protein
LNSSRSSTPYRSQSNNEKRNKSEESGIVNNTDLTDILKNLNETLNMLAEKPRSVAKPFVAPVVPQQNYYDSNEYYGQQTAPTYNGASYGNFNYPNTGNNGYYQAPNQQPQPNNTTNNNSYSSELLNLLKQQQEQINHLQKNTITKDFTNNANNSF